MGGIGLRMGVACALLLGAGVPARAQEGAEIYVGALGGVSALSADTISATSGPAFQLSTYAPENGPALNVFAGIHLSDYATIQGNYFWNRNEVRLETASGAPTSGAFDAVTTRTAQHTVVAEFLLYFRERRSMIRPYLTFGAGVFQLSSQTLSDDAPTVTLLPDGTYDRVTPVARVAVGIDVALDDRWRVRYSFSEGISPNPISDRLTPPGERVLMNFQNLVGFLVRF